MFSESKFSGYIDFDLSQKNIKIFDICYFLTGLLAEESGISLQMQEWLKIVEKVISGYESVLELLPVEKEAIPCVMESIEILFVAYFISINDLRCANDAADIFHYIQEYEREIRNII